MNKKLAPGDLAIVIKSTQNKSVGKIVECIEVAGMHSKYGVMWLVSSSRKDLITDFGVLDRAHLPQDWLRKIPNDPLPDEEDHKVLDLITWE